MRIGLFAVLCMCEEGFNRRWYVLVLIVVNVLQKCSGLIKERHCLEVGAFPVKDQERCWRLKPQLK